jgi:adenylate cyclase class IV
MLTNQANVEFKAELRDLRLARSIARLSGATCVLTCEQTDTYFSVVRGRLKKREERYLDGTSECEWIFYERPDGPGARTSRYSILSPEEAAERFGALPLPCRVVVRKQREVHMLENVRIHLDVVEDLGSFLEFEAIVSPAHNMGRCKRQVEHLRKRFTPALGEAIAVSYSDLLEAVAA